MYTVLYVMYVYYDTNLVYLYSPWHSNDLQFANMLAASKMSCNCGRCSLSSTAACQVMGVIDLLLEQQNTRRENMLS